MRKYVFPHVNNKDADQSAHPRSLINVFIIRCLDSIISLLYMRGLLEAVFSRITTL